MNLRLHARRIPGKIRDIQISEPIIFADNEPQHRSGHLGHALTEFAPGKIMAFNSNTSGYRGDGHAHFGWMEYSISEDYGETFGEKIKLPYAWKEFIDGMHTIAVEKAVTLDNGEIVAFCLVNTQENDGCMAPWSCPTLVISADQGKTWSDPIQVTQYVGRIYDVLYHEGVVYILQTCNPVFKGSQPDHLYRLFKSEDNCRSFQEVSVLPFDPIGRGYGALVLKDSGDLMAFAYNIKDEYNMDYTVSHDMGKTWEAPAQSFVDQRIRNPQIGRLDGQYILHGRAGENEGGEFGAFVMYTSEDCIHWSEGTILVDMRQASFYSENLTLVLPDGSQKMLLKYSENYKDKVWGVSSCQVNSMMLTITSCKK